MHIVMQMENDAVEGRLAKQRRHTASLDTFFQTTSAKLAKTPTISQVAQRFEVINTEPELYCVLPAYIRVHPRLLYLALFQRGSIIRLRTSESFMKAQTCASAWIVPPMNSKLDDFRLSEYDWMSAML